MHLHVGHPRNPFSFYYPPPPELYFRSLTRKQTGVFRGPSAAFQRLIVLFKTFFKSDRLVSWSGGVPLPPFQCYVSKVQLLRRAQEQTLKTDTTGHLSCTERQSDPTQSFPKWPYCTCSLVCFLLFHNFTSALSPAQQGTEEGKVESNDFFFFY